jgi:glutathione S-transferase
MFIYELPMSLYSFKLRLAIALKGAAIEARVPPSGSYRSDEFKRINPAGTIPVLVDGDFVLSESDAIVEYLDDRSVGAALLPADAQLRARTRMLSRLCDTRLEPHVRSLFSMVKPAGRDADAIAAADARIAAALTVFEHTLDEEGPSALGPAPGLADCGLTATAIWLSAITPALPLSARPGDRLARTVEAMQANQATAGMIDAYRALVDGWVSKQLA